MRKGGRIVNVSSASGGLAQFSPNLRERFRDPRNTLEDVEELVQEYEVRVFRLDFFLYIESPPINLFWFLFSFPACIITKVRVPLLTPSIAACHTREGS